METIAFLAVIGCFCVVALWYIANEEQGSSGENGFLAVSPKEYAPPPQSYLEKPRRTEAPLAVSRQLRWRRYGLREAPSFRVKGPTPRLGDHPNSN
ncbi:MAG: hypothetical protein WD076_06600 [Parvularculaceae bacterium]